jgi:ribose-phosphate pyrophosphokinase
MRTMQDNNFEMKIFSGRAHPQLAADICQALRVPLGKMSLGNFPDGEISVRIEEDVRGRDVFLVQPTCPPVNENLMELLIMIDSFRRASAARITAVLPYYGYARQDRKDVGRVPISAKLVANLLTVAGANRVLTVDLHAYQIQGFFDIPVDHLLAAPVFDEYIKRTLRLESDELVIVSPDEGRIKMALAHQKKLGGGLAIVDKRRSSATETRQANLIGDPLRGKVALLFDDMIATGGSIVGAAQVCARNGARSIYAFATHAVLCGPAIERLREAPFNEIVVTDSIPVPPEKRLPNLRILSLAPMLGEAVRRIHRNESVSALFQ